MCVEREGGGVEGPRAALGYCGVPLSTRGTLQDPVEKWKLLRVSSSFSPPGGKEEER